MDYNMRNTEFERLFLGFYNKLYYFTVHMVQDNEVARDIVSDCFGDVWRNRDNVKKEKIIAYLFSCARNKSITYLAKFRHRDDINKYSSRLVVADSDENWKEREMRYCMVEQVMETLSPRTRFVLQKCYIEHFTYKEVAQMLGISTNGVKKHIVKGMSILRGKVSGAA